VLRVLIDSQPSNFHDPQLSSERFAGEPPDQRANQLIENMGGGLRRKAQHCDARKICRVVLEGIGEIEVQADECPPFTFALPEQFIIQRSLKLLQRGSTDVMPGRFKRLAGRISQILVQLELQAVSSIGIGTKRSRAISDP